MTLNKQLKRATPNDIYISKVYSLDTRIVSSLDIDTSIDYYSDTNMVTVRILIWIGCEHGYGSNTNMVRIGQEYGYASDTNIDLWFRHEYGYGSDPNVDVWFADENVFGSDMNMDFCRIGVYGYPSRYETAYIFLSNDFIDIN